MVNVLYWAVPAMYAIIILLSLLFGVSFVRAIRKIRKDKKGG